MTVMRSTPASGHATHDEMLVARLFGDDLDTAERERAEALISSCDECAQLLADLGSIAAATAAVPAAARPREFTLTEADAARLRRRFRPSWAGVWRWARPLGGTMAAIGLAGVLLVGLTGGPAATRLGLPPAARPVSPGYGFAGGPTAAPARQEASAAPAAAATSGSEKAATDQHSTPGGSTRPATAGQLDNGATAPSPAASTGAVSVPSAGPATVGLTPGAATARPTGAAGGAGTTPNPTGTATSGTSASPPSPSNPPGQTDQRALLLLGSSVLFGLGLALAVAGIVARRLGGH